MTNDRKIPSTPLLFAPLADLYCEGERLVPDLDTAQRHQHVADPAGAAQDGEHGHRADEVVEVGLAARHLHQSQVSTAVT